MTRASAKRPSRGVTLRRRKRRVGDSEQPKWSVSADERAWLLCTASWALKIDPCSEERAYVHFAIQGLARLGLRDEVSRIAEALLATRCERDVLRIEGAYEGAAIAFLALDDE